MTFETSSLPTKKHPLYPHLLSPLHLRVEDDGGEEIVLANRVLMGSMHTGLEGHSIPNPCNITKRVLLRYEEDDNDEDDDHNDDHQNHSLRRMAQYFKERAQGGVSLMVTGGVAPNKTGWTGPFGAKLTTKQEMEAHKVVTEAVHSVDIPIYGTSTTVKPKICLQILHTGRYAYHPFPDSASSTKSPISPFQAREMSISRIQTTIKDFTTTALLAQEAGYDGVEIMGSEGYLLCQFLSPRTNHRKDEYGSQSLENRMRFPLQVVKQIRAAIKPKFIIIFRISLLDLVDGGSTFEETCQFARALENAGVTILNTGIGWHEARIPTIAPCVPRGAYTFVTKRLKEANIVNIPLVCTNRINMPHIAESILSDGTSDLISMARPLLADPQFIQKATNQQSHLINTCIACNQACLDHAFTAKTASCLVNPRACHETQMPMSANLVLEETQKLNIHVVGGGPAGCAFAITASQLGHTVTLYEQDSCSIGGQFHMAKRVPGKEEFYETIRYFTNQLHENNVVVKLNTKVSYDDMKKINSSVDKWIISTGVTPRDPQIPAANKRPKSNVLSYVDVLKHNRPVGQRVAIIGAGGIGFDVAEYLLHHNDHDESQQQRRHDKKPEDVSCTEFYDKWGIDEKNMTALVAGGEVTSSPKVQSKRREVHMLQRKKGKLGSKTLGKTTGWIHRASLKAANVNMINGVVSYDNIDDHGYLHYTAKGGKQYTLEVDTIVLCTGQVEQNDLVKATELDPTFDNKVYTIGGCYKANKLDAKVAIDQATRLAYKIHEDGVIPGKHIFESPVGAEEALTRLLLRFM